MATRFRLRKEDTMYALEGAVAVMLFSAVALVATIALLLIIL